MWRHFEPIWLLDLEGAKGPKGPKGPKGDKKKHDTKFHSEAETERGTLRLALCGPVLSRFGPKTSRLWGGGARNGGGVKRDF